MPDYYLSFENPPDFDSDGTHEDIEYHFDLVQNLDDDGQIDALRIKGGADANTNIHLSFLPGKAREIPIQWLIYDNGTDKSDGTFNTAGISDADIANNTVETIDEQKIYLKYYMYSGDEAAQWKLYGGEYDDPDRDGTDEGTSVIINRLNIREISDRPQVMLGDIRLEVGQRV